MHYNYTIDFPTLYKFGKNNITIDTFNIFVKIYSTSIVVTVSYSHPRKIMFTRSFDKKSFNFESIIRLCEKKRAEKIKKGYCLQFLKK